MNRIQVKKCLTKSAISHKLHKEEEYKIKQQK